MDTRINNGMCRCCASEGTFKDLTSTYHWMGEAEVYADMLKECFDIILSKEEDCDDNGICEVCITQLRNASNFKKQVLHTEEQFKQRLQDKLFKTNIVKVELANTEEAIDSDNDNASEGYSGADFEVPIKVESLEEVKPKKRAAKASTTTTRAKKAKIDAGETSTKRMHQEATFKSEMKDEMNDDFQGNESNESDLDEKDDEPIIKMVKVNELDKHFVNIKEILNNSNATPFKGYIGIGYMCCYCSEQFPDPSDLKKHTKEMHSDVSKACFMKEKMFEYSVKLDITDLTCNICKSSIDTVENLIDHLHNNHDIKMYKDIKNHILPFKFKTENLQCFICQNVFHKFRTLLMHMSSSHYRNYVCDVCDVGFVTLRHLSSHKVSHKTGTFSCEFCPKVYNTKQKMKMHERVVHSDSGNKMLKCGYCIETFKWYHAKEKHLSEVHGVRSSFIKCQACEKTFTTRSRYTLHMKRDHLMQRPHECPQCDMKFSDTSKLKNHIVSHSGVKEFKCDVCLKSYARKKTLTEHMKIHNNDRRFKCEHCGQAFVQKCSWRGHMRSKHSELV